MTTNNEPKSIDPIVWLGPQVFQVTFQDGRKVYLRQDNKGWYACSSAEETYDGGTIVAGGQADLLDAARNALPAASRLTDLHDLERRQRDAREHAAKRWAHYIRRGANGTGAAGTESTGENMIIELAATRLPCGLPALSLLDRFSDAELAEIRQAMRDVAANG